jgi:hypothetical protein
MPLECGLLHEHFFTVDKLQKHILIANVYMYTQYTDDT